MKIIRDPLLRRLFLKQPTSSRFQQRRWAKVHDIKFNDARFHATHTTHSRIIDKYRDKLNLKAKEEGLPDISALRESYKARIEATKQKALSAKSTVTQPLSRLALSHDTQVVGQPPPAPSISTPRTSKPHNAKPSGPPIQTLSSFVDLEKIRTLPPQEIENVWRLLHAKNSFSLCAVIPAPTYAYMALMARKHPQFILPVPRDGQGAEIHFLQWTFPSDYTASVIFTQLAEYKVRGEYASPHTTLTLHSELLQDKGLVLAQGGVQEKRGMTPEDGKWLLMCLQKFYGAQAGKTGERRKLLEQFSSGDSAFEIERLLDEAERI